MSFRFGILFYCDNAKATLKILKQHSKHRLSRAKMCILPCCSHTLVNMMMTWLMTWLMTCGVMMTWWWHNDDMMTKLPWTLVRSSEVFELNSFWLLYAHNDTQYHTMIIVRILHTHTHHWMQTCSISPYNPGVDPAAWNNGRKQNEFEGTDDNQCSIKEIHELHTLHGIIAPLSSENIASQ